MKKYSPEECMKIIIDVAKQQNYNGCFLVAKAKIESNLNNLAKNGKYAGLFQLSDGIGGAKGDQRFDPVIATKATIYYINHNRKQIEPSLIKAGMKWEDWMGYMAHQQGAGGFRSIVLSPNTLIETSPKKTAILNNLPKAARKSVKTHGDFVNYWRKRFTDLTNQCYNEVACLGYDTGLSAGACKLDMASDLPSQYRESKDTQNTMILAGIGLLTGYLLYKVV